MTWAKRIENSAAEEALKWLKGSNISKVIDLAEIATRFRQGNASEKHPEDAIVYSLIQWIEAEKNVDHRRPTHGPENVVADRAYHAFCSSVGDYYAQALNIHPDAEMIVDGEKVEIAIENRKLFLETHLGQTEFEPIHKKGYDGLPDVHMDKWEAMHNATHHQGYIVASELLETIEDSIIAGQQR